MAVSSYGVGARMTGIVRLIMGLERDIRGKHVLLVEDIILNQVGASSCGMGFDEGRAGQRPASPAASSGRHEANTKRTTQLARSARPVRRTAQRARACGCSTALLL